jgi:YggT family protein
VDILVDALRLLVFLFIIVLFSRVILSVIIGLSHDWKPTGAALVLTEGVYTVTDPPVKAMRRLIPPFSVGQFRIDLGFMVLLLLATFTYSALGWI